MAIYDPPQPLWKRNLAGTLDFLLVPSPHMEPVDRLAGVTIVPATSFSLDPIFSASAFCSTPSASGVEQRQQCGARAAVARSRQCAEPGQQARGDGRVRRCRHLRRKGGGFSSWSATSTSAWRTRSARAALRRQRVPMRQCKGQALRQHQQIARFWSPALS
jgi:hypothetical protein